MSCGARCRRLAWRPGRVPSRILTLMFAFAGVAMAMAGCRSGLQLDACHAEFRTAGPYLKGGEVWDDLHVWCDPPPTTFSVSTQIEYAPFDNFTRYGRSTITNRTPNAAGFVVSPHFACDNLTGRYRATATARASDPSGQIATATLVGLVLSITAADCARS